MSEHTILIVVGLSIVFFVLGYGLGGLFNEAFQQSNNDDDEVKRQIDEGQG